MDERAEWDNVSFVISSEVRTRVLEKLGHSKSTPTLLAKAIDQPISHVSRALRELEERKLVVLLTPERKKARLYDITAQGRHILDRSSKLREER